MPATKTHAPITVKKGSPSKPGEAVDTSKAQVIPPPSAEVQAHAKAKGSDASIPKNIRPKAAKVKAKSTTKGKQVARITDAWTGKSGKDVLVGCTVKAPGIASLKIIGRWTKRSKEQLIPFVTGTTPDGTRKNVAAADCTVVKVPAAKK